MTESQGSPAARTASIPAAQTGAVVRELIEELSAVERKLREHAAGQAGDGRDIDEQSLLEGYKWLFSILRVGMLAYVWGDTDRPRFVDIVGPDMKWGGDNADAYYQFAPIDPQRSYRVTGRRGDAVYLSVTVYGGPDDGRYSDRIVGVVNDRELTFDNDGNFSFWIGPSPQEGPGILLAPDAVCAITRDYLVDPVGGRRAEFRIESQDKQGPPRRESDADLARRFAATLTWLRDQAALVPLGLGAPNSVDPPYPVPTVTRGWAAGDAAYAMGSFELADDEALVIEGRSPECAFWNLCLWNQFMHTYDYAQEQVTINGGQVRYQPDGSWRIVVAAQDPGVPNWVSTAGHRRGRLWFRWFLPAAEPERPSTKVCKVSEVRAG